MDEIKKQKTKKILNIVLNVVVVVVLVFALWLTITNISTKKKGYSSLFGSAYMVVQTDSMDAERPAQYADKKKGFAPGDLIRVKILKDKAKYELEEGDIISFYITVVENNEQFQIINSHRIVHVEKKYDDNGNLIDVAYNTRGDNSKVADNDPWVITASAATGTDYSIIGVVKGNLGAIGKAVDFFQSSTGFLICIVIPSFLVVAYFAYKLIWEILKTKKAGAAEEKDKLKEELLAELRAEGKLNEETPAPAEEGKPSDSETTEEEQQNK